MPIVAAEQTSLVRIAAVFARYANLTLGGGSATIAVLREQILARRAWITEHDFNLAYALSRLTPGTNLLAFCTAAGFMARRWAGAIVALLASSLPCSALVVLATFFYDSLQANGRFRAALVGALAAAVAVMLNTAWVLAAPHMKAAPGKAFVIVPGAIVLVMLTHASSIHVLALAAAIGLLWPAQTEPTEDERA
jgi:chromate transporter